jgi:hypothetical protein
MGVSSPEAANPAKRPERVVETKPEDIVLGNSYVRSDETSDIKTQGKRALIKPSGGAAAGSTGSGLNV